MSNLKITIPLSDWIASLIANKHFAVISEAYRNDITSIKGYECVCHIENSEDTRNWTGEPMSIAPNLYRLWHRSTWDVTENRRVEDKKRIDEAHALSATKRQSVVNGMIKLGVNPDIANKMVDNLDSKSLEALYVNSKE